MRKRGGGGQGRGASQDFGSTRPDLKCTSATIIAAVVVWVLVWQAAMAHLRERTIRSFYLAHKHWEAARQTRVGQAVGCRPFGHFFVKSRVVSSSALSPSAAFTVFEASLAWSVELRCLLNGAWSELGQARATGNMMVTSKFAGDPPLSMQTSDDPICDGPGSIGSVGIIQIQETESRA
ncbi:hypothetical protein EV126DRAFT_54476 [Verticillium dahliae]|nr:hypothetical protein EV126DRAFT_54476 [Verticillium dahliae]